ncbi:MAG TPA: hypothetical protein VGA20_01850 [Gemmatimonadales bacterium]
MSPRDSRAAPSLCAALATLLIAPTCGTAQALFASADRLDLTLAVDLRALLKDRGDDRQEHPGKLTLVDGSGNQRVLDVDVRTRGNFRLRRSTCAFPPLRLDFPKQGTEDTPFAGQDKLKLVTHCQRRAASEQDVLHEYLLYRILNLLTDKSFRARLARVTYRDTGGGEDSVTRYAVLLESDGELTARHAANLFEQQGVSQDLTDREQMGIVSVYQYLIGNTDWSVAGLHNIVLLRDSAGTPYAVPYDFDWSGVIFAPYAAPAPQIGTKSVRERVYRGYCPEDADLAALVALFNAHKDAIYALYRNQDGLEPREVSQTLAYFDDFYRTLNDPRSARREFRRNCQSAR